MKKVVSALCFFAMCFFLLSLMPNSVLAEETTDPWDLRNFVQDVTIFDLNSDPPELVDPADYTLYVGNTYMFAITFAETPYLQFEYNEDGVLVFQLPDQLYIQDEVQETPIYRPDTNDVIGWYEIDDTGLVTVWFGDVEDDVYEDVSFTLEILAYLADEVGYGLDFGNGVIVGGIMFLDIVMLAGDGYSSDLADFVTSVTIYDISQDPAVQITPGDTTYIGNTYKFVINFAETPLLQLEYNLNGMLVYQLPSGLNIQTAVAATPIRIANGAVVGRYTIDTTGLVQVWFDNVDQNGIPTTDGTNYIDLTDVTLTLEIFAQLMSAGDGGLDFGNNIVVEIEPPVPPPPSLTMFKTSRYDPNTERIYYMITITALEAPVRNIWLSDAPTINGNPILNNPNAFYGFRFALNGGTNFTPMDVNWFSPTLFTYYFGDLVLNPDNFITILYYLDLPILIANNPDLVPSLLSYDFTVSNQVSVTGDDVTGVTDSTVDRVIKTFPISKTGEAVSPSPPDEPYYQIKWTITIGDGSTTRLNGGVITDTLGADLFLPTADGISITLYDNYTNIRFQDTATNFSGDFAIGSGNNNFTLTIPDTYGNIYRAVIVFYTRINSPPSPGEPAMVYENSVNFNDGTTDFGTGGRMPFTPPSSGIISKTTSGICGNPQDGYFVDYTIIITVPGGLLDQPIYLFDTLSVGRTGIGVLNIPQNLNVAATMEDGTALPTPLLRTAPINTGANNSAWRIYFGTTVAPADGGIVAWQYSQPVVLTITYSIYLDAPTINTMKNDNTAQLTNSVYLINSPNEPVLAGLASNAVAGGTVNDSWPIFKTGTATGNPGLFNYTVTIKGDYSSRTAPLLQAGNSPIFTDTFDARLRYVPGSFYVVDMGTQRRYFAPAPGTDVTVSGNSFSVNFTDLYEFTAPPSSNGTSLGLVTDWFAFNRNFEVRYQLYLTEMGTAISDLTNTVSIAVNPGECTFENSTTLGYTPNPLSKTMAPTSGGSEHVHVEIVINPDGAFMFAPEGETVGPDEITARDILTNLMLYVDTVEFYTQTFIPIGSSGAWDGVWTAHAISYNDGALWSVNVVSTDIVDFVLPNQVPVKIVYEALVTIPIGETGDIKNEISIFGTSDDAGEDEYYVSGSDAGAGASQLDLRVFKRDSVGNNLRGATFNLYVTVLPGYSAPAGLTDALTITVADGTTRNFYLLLEDVTTDANGIAVFSNTWLNATYQLLFLLVETQAPYGYTWLNENTFFTINPRISDTTIAEHELILGAPINQISDFINIINISDHLDPGSLRIRKNFIGLTNYEILQHLQDFQIVITDTLGVEHTFGLAEALDPFGIVLQNIAAGTYFITEVNYDVPGYTLVTTPQLPLRRYIMPNDQGEVLISIDNTYTPITPPIPPTPITPEVPPIPPTPITPEIPPIPPRPITPGVPPYTPEPPEPITPEVPPYPPTPITPEVPPYPTEPSYPPEPTELPTAPPPGPQTGNDRPTTSYVVMLIAGIGLMGSATVYLAREKILALVKRFVKRP
ncbi:MAG: SpaA isopeptide-forming pilin-related protein [Oscillospiraceae bacterium]|nr:SpaA isopeptide-forming pilin-related protein [Oscillospiraceae bacterium]